MCDNDWNRESGERVGDIVCEREREREREIERVRECERERVIEK